MITNSSNAAGAHRQALTSTRQLAFGIAVGTYI